VKMIVGMQPFSAGLTISARPFPLALRIAAGIAAVVLLEMLTYAVVGMTGGLPNAFGHLAYAGIVLAAYLYGWRGAVLAGLFGAFLVGPFADFSGMRNDGQQAWLTRGIAYTGVGFLTGLLFERARTSIRAWRDTALRVATREREGMVALARGAEAKDTDTGDHIKRVQRTSERLALASGTPVDDASAIGWAGMLHDVGKLHVPDRILLKPGPLSASEWAIMRKHPIWGEQILADAEGFALARKIARWHHENFDGTGYPDGIAGIHIPFEVRIVRVADAFDAMTHNRPYRKARSVEAALEELDRCSGLHFDPDLVRLLITIVREEQGLMADFATTPRLLEADIA
jgi:HD domain